MKGQLRETPCCGGTIKAIRRSRNLTQDDLARAAGVSRSAIAQWETNRVNFGLKARRIAAALDVPVGSLQVADDVVGDPDALGLKATSESERSLLRCYREIEEEDQALLLHLVRSFAVNGTDVGAQPATND